jgi:hypothetical protein
MGSEVLRLMT